MNSLFILDINPLLVISFANIFSHSVDCFLFVNVYCWKLLSLIRSHLLIFAFICFALKNRSKKILLRFMSKSVLPIFFSRIFMVYILIFKSLIHFESVFENGLRKCSNLIAFLVTVQFFQHHLLKTLFLPQCILFPPLNWSHRLNSKVSGSLRTHGL